MSDITNRRDFTRVLGCLAFLPAVESIRHLPLAPRLPVGESADPTARTFLDALLSERTIAFFYQGGSSPGALRRVTPHSVHRLAPGGPVYVHGFCHLREAARTFRLDRVRPA